MTDDECREAYDHIAGSFDLVHEIWMTKATPDKDAEPVEWHAVLQAVPYLSLNDLEQIEDWMRLGSVNGQPSKFAESDDECEEPDTDAVQ